MPTESNIEPGTRYTISEWTLNLDSSRLEKEGAEVRLEPKVVAVLVFLARHAGKVVSREELEAHAWAGTVVGYDAVAGCIIKLRRALGDDARHPRYIETITKKGYRLIAPVSTSANTEHMVAVAKPTLGHLIPARSPTRQVKKQVIAAWLSVLVIAGLLLTVLRAPYFSGPPAATSTSLPGVLVLPFKNLSDDPKQEYLSDGITDDLITDLSRSEWVRVIARQTAFHYKNNTAEFDEIARELSVSYIVEGSIRRYGKRIRVNVQLTETKNGESAWAERFDFDVADLFKVQDRISQSVMSAMLVPRSGKKPEPQESRGTRNFEAYEAFLVGQQYIQTRSKSGYEQGMRAFQRAIEIDPNYARAYGAMAVALTRGYRYQWTDISAVEARERAYELANKAIELGPATPQIYWALGYVHLHRHEYDAAERAAKQSVALSPNYADGHALLANVVNWRGKPVEAETYIKKAIALNPYYTSQYQSTLGLAYYNLGRYEEAILVLREAINQNISAPNSRLFLAATFTRLKRMPEANWEIDQVSLQNPNITLGSLKNLLPFENTNYLDVLREDLRKAGLRE